MKQPDLSGALGTLRAGDLVAIPTETVYGLAADASNPDAVAKVFALKGRPSTRPLIVHIPSAGDLDDWAINVPDYARRLAETLWPGPMALVLERQHRVPDAVTGGQDTVALRVPNHPMTLDLLAKFSGGLAAPSANRYGQISPTTPEHVRQEFGDQTPNILDGGPCEVGIESTIVSCLEAHPRILRPGVLTAADIARAAGVSVDTGPDEASAVVVPGQVQSHYAPRTDTQLLPFGQPDQWESPVGRVGFIGFSVPAFPTDISKVLPLDPAEAARKLYGLLRALDGAGLDLILVEAPPQGEAWSGLRDRLERAAAR